MNIHTNGPWFVGRPFGSNSTAIIGDGDSVVCTLDGRHGSLAKADANLIAAAPELLEAAEWCVALCEELDATGTNAYASAKSAIAKARGES